jgi:hypothetical protein
MDIEIMGHFTCSPQLIEQIKTDLHLWCDCILEGSGVTYCIDELGLTTFSDRIAISGKLSEKAMNMLRILKGRFDTHNSLISLISLIS